VRPVRLNPRLRRRLVAIGLLAVIAVTTGACAAAGIQVDHGVAGTGNSAQLPTRGPEVVARPVAPFGTVLTTGSGYALYVFAPDAAKRVSCSGNCLSDWPPLRPRGPVAGIAGAGVRRSLLGEDRDSTGRPVVTYAGWPLYTYVGDSAPGYPSGQALDSDGGLWYLISAGGKVVKTSG